MSAAGGSRTRRSGTGTGRTTRCSASDAGCRWRPSDSTQRVGILRAGDPRGDAQAAWWAKEAVRELYEVRDPSLAGQFIDELITDMADRDWPVEVRSMGRTLPRRRGPIIAWHDLRISNGPTEAMNNLAKRIKRVGFGFRSFTNYRIRTLAYAGKPDWSLLGTLSIPG